MTHHRIYLSLVLMAASASAGAQTPQGRTRSPSVVSLAGLYRIAPHHEIAISVQQTPSGALPFFIDLVTGQARVLFPDDSGGFAAGPELARPQPAQFHARFHLTAERADSLTMSEPESKFTARRVSIRAEEVSFQNAGIAFHGTLLLPANVRRSALVVLAVGSEDSDRYSLGPIPYVLANRGIAVLMYDKRGTGKTKGSWEDASVEDLAGDLATAIREMGRRRDIDPKRIGILGFSEGGWVAPLTSTRVPVDFIIAISGGGTTKGRSFTYKNRRRAEEAGLRDAALDSVVRTSTETITKSIQRAKAGGGSGFDRRVAYDPRDDWARFKGPVLSIGGEFDVLEDSREAADSLRAFLQRAGNHDVTIHVLPRAHHFPFIGRTGLPSEWGTFNGFTRLAPGFWEIMLLWLSDRGYLK